MLWTLVLFNMLFADIFSIMTVLVTGNGIHIPGEVKTVMAIAAVVTNIPILMIWFSRTLTYTLNKKLNIIASLITIFYIIGGGSLTPHYIIIAAIETILLLVIIRLAWHWKNH